MPQLSLTLIAEALLMGAILIIAIPIQRLHRRFGPSSDSDVEDLNSPTLENQTSHRVPD
jgi:hypothetical protein